MVESRVGDVVVHELNVEQLHPVQIKDGEGGIRCVVSNSADRPLVLIVDETERFGGASASNAIEVVIDWLSKKMGPSFDWGTAQIYARDSVGMWDVASACFEDSELIQVELASLTWPGTEPRSDAAMKGVLGRRWKVVSGQVPAAAEEVAYDY